MGSIWGIVLDCGEDKPDSHEAYGFTNVCHAFRTEQTAFLRDVIARAAQEYAEEGVTHRLVISHNPFSYTHAEPFDIEYGTYTEWIKLLSAHVKPHAMIAGHLHICEVRPQGGELDSEGAIPVIVGSAPVRENKEVVAFTGAAITLSKGHIDVAFTNDKGEVSAAHRIA